MRHLAHGDRSTAEGLLDLLRIHNEELGRKRGLVFLRGIRPEVPHVGFQPSRNSPRMAGVQIVLEVNGTSRFPASNLPTASEATAALPQLKARSVLAVGTDHNSSLSGATRASAASFDRNHHVIPSACFVWCLHVSLRWPTYRGCPLESLVTQVLHLPLLVGSWARSLQVI